MKNNFITKIIGATLAFAMMIGGAVGINAAKQAKAVFADDPAYTLTYVKNTKNSAYATAYTVSSNGVDWEVYANISTTAGYYIGGKSNNNLTRTFTSTDYLSTSIDRIVVHTATMDAASASVTAKASTNSSFASNVKTFSSVNLAANGNFEIICDEGTDADSYFQLTFTVNPSNTSSNKKVVVTSIDFYEHVQSQETVTGVTASIKDGVYYAGHTLSHTDFDVTVSWSGEKEDTHPLSGFTWTVNDVANGTLNEGDNSVVVTFQNVSSPSINVVGTRDTRWDTQFTTSLISDIELPDSGDTDDKYYVVAEITAITDTNYGNGSAIDENGTTFAIYGMRNFNGNLRYGQMVDEQKPVVGDVVVLYGVFTRYNNAPEIKNAWVLQRNGVVFETPALTGITLNRSTLELKEGEQFALTAAPAPVDAELGEVEWISDNDDVATVSSNGNVTATGIGSATITASASNFTATCNVTVVLSATLDLSTDTTADASATLLAWEVENRFAMKAEKASASTATNNYYPGTSGQSYTSTRFYKNSKLTLTPDPVNVTAIKAEFLATTDGYATKFASSTFVNATAAVSATNSKLVIVTFTDGLKPFVATISDTCGFTSVELVYSEASARQKIEYGLTTQTQLSYRYTGNAQDGFQYSDISIRFGANMTKALWDELDTNEHLISGFGVIIADGDLVTNAADMAEAMNDKVSSTVTTTFTQEVYAIDYFVPVADMASTIGVDGNNYFWNLRWTIDEANMDKMYTAAAYIKVGSEYVLMKIARESVVTLAQDYLKNRDCTASTAEGSLKAIVDNA